MWMRKRPWSHESSQPSALLASSITLESPSSGSRLQPTTLQKPGRAVKGTISGDGDLCINGIVDQPISVKCDRLTVGPSAQVTAQVVASEVVVYGNICGNLRARDRIEIKKQGAVVGDLTTAHVLIEDGAYLRGSIEIERRKRPRNSVS